MRKTAFIVLAAALAPMSIASKAHDNTPNFTPVNAAYVFKQRIAATGELVGAYRVIDRGGEHLLVLNSSHGPSPSNKKSGRTEYIKLNAQYYSRNAGVWSTEWTVNDFVDCPGLDVAASFFTESLSFTDLNKDGLTEITIPYKMFCGGGVDPSTVKVILRDGTKKFAIRGESLIKLPGQEPFGGEHAYDKSLQLPTNSAYKKHMETIWLAVSVDERK